MLSAAQTRPEDCISKIRSGFGPILSCTSEDSYHVILKSNCKSTVDVVCGIQERSGEWKVFKKDRMQTGDTLLAFGCDGAGKFQYWVRFSGDTSHLPTYAELNPDRVKKTDKFFDLFAKLLYGDQKKEPLKNQKVELLNSKGETVQSSVTDQYGDFVFHKLSNAEKYEVFVGDVSLPATEKLFIAKQNGLILNELKWVKDKNYRYSFLPSDMVTLSEMEVDDPAFLSSSIILSLESQKKNKSEKFMVTEQIYYESGAVKPNDLTRLGEVIKFMNDNPGYFLEIVSHTDSRGDDSDNLKLSSKRSDFVKSFLVGKGVSSSRIRSRGEGENKIRNRCLNGVNCSEKEHILNRRTEFYFSIQPNK